MRCGPEVGVLKDRCGLEAEADATADGGVIGGVFSPVVLGIGEYADAAGKTVVKTSTSMVGGLIHAVRVVAATAEDVRSQAKALDRETEDHAAADLMNFGVGSEERIGSFDTDVLCEKVVHCDTTAGGIFKARAFGFWQDAGDEDADIGGVAIETLTEARDFHGSGSLGGFAVADITGAGLGRNEA